MTTGILFMKNTSPITKLEFCEVCSLGKQYKVHSIEQSIDTTTKLGVHIHVDLFGGRNTLPAVRSY